MRLERPRAASHIRHSFEYSITSDEKPARPQRNGSMPAHRVNISCFQRTSALHPATIPPRTPTPQKKLAKSCADRTSVSKTTLSNFQIGSARSAEIGSLFSLGHIDCSTRAADYIQHYAGDEKLLLQSLELIRDVAAKVIGALTKETNESESSETAIHATAADPQMEVAHVS